MENKKNTAGKTATLSEGVTETQKEADFNLSLILTSDRTKQRSKQILQEIFQ